MTVQLEESSTEPGPDIKPGRFYTSGCGSIAGQNVDNELLFLEDSRMIVSR